jgi:hypothetical protein
MGCPVNANRRRAIKTQLTFFRSWQENEFVQPTTLAEPLMKT